MRDPDRRLRRHLVGDRCSLLGPTRGSDPGRERRLPVASSAILAIRVGARLMADPTETRHRYREARRRADESFLTAESLRSSRQTAEIEAAKAFEEILEAASGSEDPSIRDAAAAVRRQRTALRRSGDVLACSMFELLERLVGADSGALGFDQDADTFVSPAIDGRAALADRHLAVTRAEATLDELLGNLDSAS